MIEMFFAKEGIEGEFVNDGTEGYNRYKSGTWDALIVDWMLPEWMALLFAEKLGKSNALFRLSC